MKLLFINCKRKYIALLLFLIITLCVVFSCNFIFYLLYFLSLLFFTVNYFVKIKNAWNADHLFTTLERNYDCLVIGETCFIAELFKEKGTKIEFLAPNRSLVSSFELLKRLFSLLKEKTGTVIIICTSIGVIDECVSVLDIPYLHETQLKKLAIKNRLLRLYFPILFAPLKSIKVLIGKRPIKSYKEIICPNDEIITFCKERDINLRFVKLNDC